MAETPARRGRPPRITREQIVDTALAIAEEQGLEAVSLHKIAAALDVKTMSLYRHIADKAALLDAMGDAILAGFRTPETDGAPWDLTIKLLAREFRRTAMTYPRAAPLVLTRRLNAPGAMPIVEEVLRLSAAVGVDPDEAVHALRAFIAFLVGTLLRESSLTSAPDASPAGELDVESLPHLRPAADALRRIDHTAEFEYGLDLVVDALRLRLSPPTTETSTQNSVGTHPTGESS